jgi:DNA-binding transcriptional LysR family regulator
MHAPVLKYFSEVAARGSIRKAADNLNVASSAVNRQVLKLEEELGVLLFERVPGGVLLTAAGKILKDHIRETLLSFERVQAEINNLTELNTGVVRIASLGSLMVNFLPAVVRDFNDAYGGIKIEAFERGPAESVEEVVSGHVDIALTFTHAMERPVQIVAERETPIGVVIAASHPLAKKKAINLEDCADFPLLLHEVQLPEGPTLPIRLTHLPPTCGMLPFPRVEFVKGRCADVASDAE